MQRPRISSPNDRLALLATHYILLSLSFPIALSIPSIPDPFRRQVQLYTAPPVALCSLCSCCLSLQSRSRFLGHVIHLKSTIFPIRTGARRCAHRAAQPTAHREHRLRLRIQRADPLNKGFELCNPRETTVQTTLTSFALVSPSKEQRLPVSASVPAAAAAQDGDTQVDLPSSTPNAPSSPAFSSTSTAEEGGSSPVLPPLPAPILSGRTLDLLRPKTPPHPEHPQSGDTRYFTASWGSPYQASSSAYQDISPADGLHRKTQSNESSEPSPLRRLSIHTPFLRPAPALYEAEAVEGPVSASVLANRARRPIRGLTEDWIRQHTANDLADAEKANWFGDSNDEAEHSSLSSSLSGELEDWVTDEIDPRTPTLKSFIERRHNTQRPGGKQGHLRLQSTDTVTPEDFNIKHREAIAKMSHNRKKSSAVDLTGLKIDPLTAESKDLPAATISPVDKPLPPPPQDVPQWRQAAPLPPPKEEDEKDVPEWRQAAAPTKSPTPPPKEPTPPPKEPTPTAKQPEVPEWRAAALPAVIPEPAEEKETVPTPPPATPRIKKKIPWKAGKNIMLLLPLDEGRGQPGKPPKPLTAKDVENIQRDWQQLGYDTTGFNLDPSISHYAEEDDGQSRAIWPDGAAINEERDLRNFRVSIPDRRQWDAYVQELSEAKLRALGVSFGDEEPIPVPQSAVPNMSRQASMQYPALPFSPPIPTSSATSSHINQHQNPFSPVLMPGVDPSTSQSSNVGSIASPASMHNSMYGKFNPRQSISLGHGQNAFGSPFQFPPQQSPGVWSPQAMAFTPGHLPRGASPSISINNFGSLTSPASPFAPEGYFPQNNLPMQMQLQQRQQELQNQMQQQMHRQNLAARATPTLQDVHEDDGETVGKSPSKTPEPFAQQQSRHNASDSLQREIDDAEYHLEEQFQRQLEHDDYSPHSEKEESTSKVAAPTSKAHSRNQSSFHGTQGSIGQSRFASDKVGPVLHHPQPHSRGHSLSQRPYESEDALNPDFANLGDSSKLAALSERETDQSGRASPEAAKANGHNKTLSTISNPWAESDASANKDSEAKRSSHSVRASLSKLNVEAPEFKFNPEKTFQPSQFGFSGSSFNPSASFGSSSIPSAPITNTFAQQAPLQASDFSQSVGARSFVPSKIHADAPAFTPGQSVFSFSSSGPSFRPDAPAFNPAASSFGGSMSGLSGAEDGSRHSSKPSIFGNIDMSLKDIVKPPKKNKAVPIIRPDSTAGSMPKGSEDETMEGKDGRITQGEGRIKRVRGAGKDGDSVPLFAEPSRPLQETTREQTPAKEAAPVTAKPADKENVAVEIEHSTPPRNPQVARTRNILEDSPDYDGKSWAPWDLDHQDNIADFSAANAFLSKGSSSFKFNPDAKPVEFKFNAEAKPIEFNAANNEFKSSTSSNHHKKNTSSLSALAKPFEFGSFFKFGQGSTPPATTPQSAAPAPAPLPAVTSQKSAVPSPTTAVPSARNGGLSNSRFAHSTPSPKDPEESPVIPMEDGERLDFQRALPQPQSPPKYEEDTDELEEGEIREEPTFDEIDAVMRHMNEQETERTASRQVSSADTPRFHQPSPMRQIQIPEVHDNGSPHRLQPQFHLRSDAPSPSPGRFDAMPRIPSSQRIFSRARDDPFVEAKSDPRIGLAFDSPVHHLNASGSMPASDWDDVLSAGDETKFEARTQFFDGHVNDLIGSIVTDKLHPMSRTLETIQQTLSTLSQRGASSRRNRRSMSAEPPESDADDEDDFESARRSMSPRRDNKMEKIRRIVQEALASHGMTPPSNDRASSPHTKNSDVLRALEEMREQFTQTKRPDFQAEDFAKVIEDAVEKRMQSALTPTVDAATLVKIAALEASLADISQRNQEITERSQRAEEKVEEEVSSRRAAEDRLAEVQRLLRISSEEEDRLREAVAEKDLKIKNVEDARSRVTVRTTLLEATADSAQKSQSELQSKLNVVENELREARQKAKHWQVEAERVSEAAKKHSEEAQRQSDEAQRAEEHNSILMLAIERVKLQMQESMHTRESMRGKLAELQSGMAQAAHDVSEENARRFKKEQELIARQEVLDAKLQAEARTRERLEREIERLEEGERNGMRAIKESNIMEDMISTLRVELNDSEKNAMKFKREFEEARESGISEAQRIRNYMQSEIDSANNQVNIVRQDLEDQLTRTRADLDHVRLEVDTAKAQTEMLVEELKESKHNEIAALKAKHEDVIEDLKMRHDRQIGNTQEDSTRTEQHLLERISLSSAKTEHLQDRVSHLEEKLEIAKEAALAAAQSARNQVPNTTPTPASATPKAATASSPAASRSISALPEKISPQALRESIMVLQEQLQDRESTIESLTSQIAILDPEASAKIAKRDDEIVWLRELLSVRIGDLQDIINTVSQDEFDPIAVKDAAIRLKANLQMEEQERQRALNGGSSILPSAIEARLKEAAASPRVAQVVGPVAAAWGNWRQKSNRNISEVMNSESVRSTPTRPSPGSDRSFLSGLLTPPSAGANSRPPQSAFGSTGKRFTAEQLANRPRGPPRGPAPSARQQGKMAMPARNLAAEMSRSNEAQPTTPPVTKKNSYERDAEPGDFSDAGFFDDDDDIDADAGEVEDSMLA